MKRPGIEDRLWALARGYSADLIKLPIWEVRESRMPWRSLGEISQINGQHPVLGGLYSKPVERPAPTVLLVKDKSVAHLVSTNVICRRPVVSPYLYARRYPVGQILSITIISDHPRRRGDMDCTRSWFGDPSYLSSTLLNHFLVWDLYWFHNQARSPIAGFNLIYTCYQKGTSR